MNAIASISVSGMNAAQQRMQSSAHNIANLQTEGFRRQEVSAQTRAEGGVSTQVSTQAQPGSALEADMVTQMVAANSFLANLLVFQSAQRNMGSLLNVRA
jgi:flagellar hook-associated protein FlgK